MVTEKNTDLFIAKLLDDAKIEYIAEGSNIKEINEALKTASKRGTNSVGYPEFVGKSNDFIIVIEDKANTDKQISHDENNELNMSVDAVVHYAVNGALHYANHILENTTFKKIFAFGCSGNEKHHVITPVFVDEKGYKILSEVDNFENFNNENINEYYRQFVKGDPPREEIELENLIKKSSVLHEHLRNYGQLGDSEKPLVVSAILLALDYGLDLDSLTGDEVETDGIKIFNKMKYNLESSEIGDKENILLNKFEIIKLRPLLNNINERIGRDTGDALAKTPLKFFAEFIKKEIFPSINNVKADILGYFYGEFIKYSGGDGQTLGIVLTPKHITELFVDLLDVKPSDKIFDPCCGTGSFLISGMNKMISQTDDEETINNIKRNNIHGIEIRDDMFSIATTNMVLRGDGKSNLKLADFFEQKVEELREKNYTVGLMNPPFSQGGELSEMHFIKHLLDSLADNARCAVIVPQSTMVASNKNDKKLKKEIYKNHTLEGVISLNPDTFYGVRTITCIAIFTAHQPHPENKRCKFINFEDDGYIVNKHVGLVKTERAVERKKHLLECWHYDKDAESLFMVKIKIKPEDEWLHSFYYFNDEIPTETDFEQSIGDYLSFEFGMIMQDNDYLFK